MNKVKGRQPHYWISGQDSVNQMGMIDMAYKENGLGLRPSYSFTQVVVQGILTLEQPGMDR